MTAQPIIAVDVLDRLAGRADVREFTSTDTTETTAQKEANPDG